MLYLGFLFMALGAAVAVYEYCDTQRKRDREYAATLQLLVYLRGAVANEKRAPADAVMRFIRSGGATDVPWLKHFTRADEIASFMREGGLKSAEGGILGEDRDALSAFFFSLGRAELDEERRSIEAIIDRIEKSGDAIRQRTEGKVRSAWVLFATAAAGALLMML